MRQASIPVFCEYVDAGATVYTSVEHTALLSRADQLVLIVYVDLGATLNPGAFALAIEHCGDGRNWASKNGGEILGTLTASQRTVLWGAEPLNPHASLRFVRLAMVQSSDIEARVEVHVTARTMSRVIPHPCSGGFREQPGAPAELGLQLQGPLMDNLLAPLPARTMREVQRLAEDHQAMPPEVRLQRVQALLSQEARGDVQRWVDRLRGTEHEEKLEMARNAAMLQGVLALSDGDRGRLFAQAGLLRTLLSHVSAGDEDASAAPSVDGAQEGDAPTAGHHAGAHPHHHTRHAAHHHPRHASHKGHHHGRHTSHKDHHSQHADQHHGDLGVLGASSDGSACGGCDESEASCAGCEDGSGGARA